MSTEFDYGSVPHNYAHCFNAACPRGENCLRRLAALHAPKEAMYLCCLNPAAYPTDADTCPHYRTTEKVRLAWGISSLCNQVPYGIANSLMSCVRHSFSKPTYYRILHQERPVLVEEQRMIAELFVRSGVKELPVYDRYTESFNWKL